MSSDWLALTLGEVCEKITDGAHKSPKSVESGKPMASVKDLTRFGVDLSSARKISKDDFDELVKQGCKPQIGDVLIAKDGNSALDTVCTVDTEIDAVLLSSVAILRPDLDKLDSDFLKYYFCSPQVIDYLKTNFISGAAIPRVVLRDFRKAEIKLPPLSIQRKISKSLSSIDKKISSNSQTNKTLEQMAKTIFKSWFVDFDPVKAKMNGEQPEGMDAETASLFPEKLAESEEGLIPDGWELTTVGKVSECFDKRRVPLSKRQREERQGSIPYYGATSVMDYVDEAIFDDIYLLIGEDGSVMKADGTPFVQYIWGPAWVNNHAHVLKGIKSISTEQLMLFFQQTNINAYVTGAVQLKINQRNMNSIPFIKAPKEINERFYDVVAPLYAKIRAIKEENEQLAKLRDTLLPKLLSGEITLD